MNTETEQKRNKPMLDFNAPLSPNRVGNYLRYDGVYDQIRAARREDDSTLSQGIWQTDLKRADWPLVENLCVDVLTTQSKDLQIAAWLCEAWTVQDNLSGAKNGITMIHRLSKEFWPSIYPAPEGDDIDHRLHILDWLDDTLAMRLILVPIIPPNVGYQRPLCLSDWISALNLEKLSKRIPDGKSNLASAENQGRVTIQRFRQNMQLADGDFLQTFLADAQGIKESLRDFVLFLEEVCGKNAPGFPKIKSKLDDIIRILQAAVALPQVTQRIQSSGQKPEPTLGKMGEEVDDINQFLTEAVVTEVPLSPPPGQDDDAVMVTGRKEAYQALKQIGQFLKSLDPHSPVPALVELLGSWEDKNLVQILKDVSTGSGEAHTILKLLASASSAG
ncbi:MAG: type VI secretion system protein TssA [Alphaproteobacteria bacterium]|nr:type VI secretion system protein TssA [Alphaproteobacteria bacterium]